jgi:hypothetical protein
MAIVEGTPAHRPAFDTAVLDQHSADLDVIRSVLVLAQDDLVPGTDIRHALNAIAAVEQLLAVAADRFNEVNKAVVRALRPVEA